MPNKQSIFMIVCFAVLAIVNLIAYIKLRNYLYICAGVSKKETKSLTYEYGANNQRRLVSLLRSRTINPKEFGIMLTFCRLCIFLTFVSFVFLIAVLPFENSAIIKIAAIILTIITAVASLLGLLYGKNIERNLGDSFLRNEYTPHEDEFSPDPVNNTDEYSGQALQTRDIYGRNLSKSDGEYGRFPLRNYIVGVVMVAIILTMGTSILWTNPGKITFKSSDNPKVTESENNDYHEPTSVKGMREALAEEGLFPDFKSTNPNETYSDFVFRDYVISSKGETYFAYYELDTNEDAANFKEVLKNEIDTDFEKDEKNDKEHSEYKNGYDFYSLQTDKHCVTVISAEYTVIYAYCDAENIEWLNNFLVSLNFTDIFEIKTTNEKPFVFMIIFAALSLLSRFAFLWIKRLSYISAGQTYETASRQFKHQKSDGTYYKGSLQWLVSISPMPLLTKVLYYLYCVLITLGAAGFIISAADMFIPIFDNFLNNAAMALIGLCVLSGFLNILLYFPIIYFIDKKKKRQLS